MQEAHWLPSGLRNPISHGCQLFLTAFLKICELAWKEMLIFQVLGKLYLRRPTNFLSKAFFDGQSAALALFAFSALQNSSF